MFTISQRSIDNSITILASVSHPERQEMLGGIMGGATIGAGPEEVDYRIPGSESTLDRLVARAERLFVWNNGSKDEDLIRLISENVTGEIVRQRIKQHQQSLEQLPMMAERGQIQFLMQQIEVDRFLEDWSEYAVKERALLEQYRNDRARRR